MFEQVESKVVTSSQDNRSTSFTVLATRVDPEETAILGELKRQSSRRSDWTIVLDTLPFDTYLVIIHSGSTL